MLAFLDGMILGSLLGMVLMCLLQINRIDRKED